MGFKIEKHNLMGLMVVLMFILSAYYYSGQEKIFDASYKALSYVELGYSNIQRITKLELEGMGDDYLIIKTDNLVTELINPNKLSKYFPKNCDLELAVFNFFDDWFLFCTTLDDYIEHNARDMLFSVSETVYDNAIKNVKIINSYIDSVVFNILVTKIFIRVLVIFVTLALLKLLFAINYELHMSKELSDDMHIDVATGLYDRTKCQELLRNNRISDEEFDMERVILVINLDSVIDLNSKSRKKIGKQVTSSFATIMKDATKIFQFDVFVGRYGIYEFIVFNDRTTPKEVNIFIEELKFLLNKFNESVGAKFNLSCSVKYAMTTESNRDITSRELFHFAHNNKHDNEITI